MSTIVIDPVTRLEGHLKVEVTVAGVSGGGQQVVDAKTTGTLFRGFEIILQGRSPLDSPDITQRICGVCPVSHGVVSCKALEDAAGMSIPADARIMRNLVLGSNFIQSHILHFYHLAVQDFVNGPNMPPWQPSWSADRRFTAAEESTLVNHYLTALDMRRQAHEMGALFGGKLPHVAAFVAGGMTRAAQSAHISQFKTYLATITNFINSVYLPDVQALAGKYSDYLSIGKGYGNLLAFGVFEDINGLLLRRGFMDSGQPVQTSLNISSITEDVTHSWYSDVIPLNPASGETNPVDPQSKPAAYSWLKAPRYSGKAYELGPLARMVINGDYRGGASVMDRHLARAQEAAKIAKAMSGWIGQLTNGSRSSYTVPANATGVGLGEAPRGALGHWISIAGGVIANYQVVTPTCWNASPRDSGGNPGAIEKALIGTPVADLQQPVEVMRVIHSFDPCLSCAVHVMRPAAGARIFALGHFHTCDDAHDHNHGRSHSHAH